MSDKRTYGLVTTAILTGKYIPVDSDALPEAQKVSTSTFATSAALDIVISDLEDLSDLVAILEDDVATLIDDVATLTTLVSGLANKQTYSGITSDVSFVVPVNSKIICIDFQIETAAMTFSVGITDGGNDVVYTETNLATGSYSYPINRVDLGGETLFFDISGSGSMNIVIEYKENWFES